MAHQSGMLSDHHLNLHLFAPFPLLDDHPPAPVAVTHYRLTMSMVVWSDLPDEVSIGTISRGGDFVTFDQTLGQPNKQGHNSSFMLCNQCILKYML